jgi:biotin carboxyl carrier protein
VREENVSGRRDVVAPMSGRVVRLMVAAGDEVVKQQALVVVEAMKMENVLTAPKEGRIKKVSVREGMSVEVGQTLVSFE